MKKLLLASASIIALASASPASAGGWSVIGGVCFNPAGIAIPLAAALVNPHCVGVTVPGGGGGSGSGSGGSGGGGSGSGGGGTGGGSSGSGGSHSHHAPSGSHHHSGVSNFLYGAMWGCMGAAAMEIAGSIYMEKAHHRQITLNESYLLGASCIFNLPSLIWSFTCPDNKATRKIATIYYKRKIFDEGSDGRYSHAYVEACRTNKVPSWLLHEK